MSKSKEPPLTYQARRMALEVLDVLTTPVHELGGPCIQVKHRAAALRIIARAIMVTEDMSRKDERERVKQEGLHVENTELGFSPLPQVADDRIPCPKCRGPAGLAPLNISGVPADVERGLVEWECESCRHQFYAPYSGG